MDGLIHFFTLGPSSPQAIDYQPLCKQICGFYVMLCFNHHLFLKQKQDGFRHQVHYSGNDIVPYMTSPRAQLTKEQALADPNCLFQSLRR